MARLALLFRHGYLLALPMLTWMLVDASTAWACPVCFSAKNEDNQIAYLATTGFLTFLPLIMIGGLVLWVRRKVAELHQLNQGAVSAEDPKV